MTALDQGYRLNSDHTVVVASDYYWIPITKETPVGAKLQLLGGGGVSMYGSHSAKDKFCTHWAPLPKKVPADLADRNVHLEVGQGHRFNSNHTVVVATDYYWIPITKETPVGAKLQLLGGGGVAIYANYSLSDTFFTHWAPLPVKLRKQDPKTRLLQLRTQAQ